MSYKIPQDEFGLVTSGEFYGVATGGAIDYFVNLNNAIGPLNLAMIGKMFKVRFNVANTTNNVTLNVNGVGSSIPITKNGRQSLAPNDILTDEILLLVFDGSYYQIIGKIAANNVLPTSGTVNGPLIWDGSAWVAGTAPAVIPSGGGVNHILTWDGSQWVSTYAAAYSGTQWRSYEVQITDFVGASNEFFPQSNKTIYFINVDNFLAGEIYDIILPTDIPGGTEMMFIGRGFKNCLLRINTAYPSIPLVHYLVWSGNITPFLPYPLTWFARHYVFHAIGINKAWVEVYL